MLPWVTLVSDLMCLHHVTVCSVVSCLAVTQGHALYLHLITETVNGTAQYTLAKAIVITFVINNHVKDEDNKRAIAWEKE